MQRRLAAIMAADVVGYSRMMGADEAVALAALRGLRRDVIDPQVATHRGQVVKRMGDGWLVEFASARDAVTCAGAVQHALTDHPTIRLRIGIHLGDVTQDEDGDIYGDGVNVAARLERVAQPAGIVISDQVYSALDGTMRMAFADGGDRALKNIDRPVRLWVSPGDPSGPEAGADPGRYTTPVILLEEFALGGDVEAAADLAEELRSGLLDALSNRSGVRVATPADKVTPTYVLKGRCRVSGDRGRLHLSVTDAANGETSWTTKIDDRIGDVFGFVDEAVVKVSGAIRVHLNASEGAVYATAPDDSLNLQQLLSKAAYYFHLFDARGAELSRRTMRVALEKAPENPMVLAMQAYALMQTVPLAIERVEDIDADAVISLADRSVYHGPNVDFTFHQRARIRLWLQCDHAGCIKDGERALAINPGYHLAAEDLALADLFGGHPARGADAAEKIMKQFPTQPITPVRLSVLGIGFALAGDTETALIHAQDGYDRRPLVPLHALAYAAAAAHRDDLVTSYAFRKMVVHHGLRARDAGRFPFARAEDGEALAAMLRRAGLPD